MFEGLKRLFGMNGNHQNGSGDASSAMLSCEEVGSRIYEYIDEELDSQTAAGVKRHLEACPECYPMARFEAHFVECIQRVRSQASVRPDLEQRILAALAEEPTEG